MAWNLSPKSNWIWSMAGIASSVARSRVRKRESPRGRWRRHCWRTQTGRRLQRGKGVLEFARLLPQVSHREPALSDRDPIPLPYDNTYNMPERNFFHTKVKYHRDDAFLVAKLLDENARRAR